MREMSHDVLTSAAIILTPPRRLVSPGVARSDPRWLRRRLRRTRGPAPALWFLALLLSGLRPPLDRAESAVPVVGQPIQGLRDRSRRPAAGTRSGSAPRRSRRQTRRCEPRRRLGSRRRMSPGRPARARAQPGPRTHWLICCGSVTVRHTTSTGASITTPRSICRLMKVRCHPSRRWCTSGGSPGRTRVRSPGAARIR